MEIELAVKRNLNTGHAACQQEDESLPANMPASPISAPLLSPAPFRRRLYAVPDPTSRAVSSFSCVRLEMRGKL